jgi:hypothetical protein
MARIRSTINNAGNLDDVRNSISCGWDRITVADLEAALADEKKSRKRSSFIKLIEASIKRKAKDLKAGDKVVLLVETSKGKEWLPGTVTGFTSGEVFENRRRINVLLDSGQNYYGCHSMCVKKAKEVSHGS